jgi:hypothetical protein
MNAYNHDYFNTHISLDSVEQEIKDLLRLPEAKLVDTGRNTCVLMLKHWDPANIDDGYTEEEVSGLIQVLQESLEVMSRYNRASEKLPLFETIEENSNVSTQAEVFGSVDRGTSSTSN